MAHLSAPPSARVFFENFQRFLTQIVNFQKSGVGNKRGEKVQKIV